MSRFIDVDDLIKAIRQHMVKINSLFEEEKTVVEIIEEQPTAFDTEKVVGQIHDKYCHKCRNILGKQSSEEYCKSVKCEIDALCDIVKKGGVE